jgi:putative ABC transport system substrate-binding protein
MRRRDFINLLGGAVAAWPLAARAQQPARLRRVGFLMNLDPSNTEAQDWLAVFRQSLAQLGWVEGRNIQLDVRWASGGDRVEIRRHATDLVAQAPDIIVAGGTADMGPLLETTRTIPIVFLNVADPVGAGFINSMAHPGGNATGFLQFEYTLSGKWLELLKTIAPRVTRAVVLRDADISGGIGQFAVIQSVAPALGIEVSAIGLRDPGEIERAIAAFAGTANGGLVVTASALSVARRNLIIALAARHKLPAVYYRRDFADNGGLISYGYDAATQYRGAATYVDRILNGEKPSDLPVQAPTKYELVVNLKTAKALGLTVPPTLLTLADEVIE